MKRTVISLLFMFFFLTFYVSADESAITQVVVQDGNIKNIHLFQEDNSRYIRSIHIENENYTVLTLFENVSYAVLIEEKERDDFFDMMMVEGDANEFQKTYVLMYGVVLVILIMIVGIMIYIIKRIIK